MVMKNAMIPAAILALAAISLMGTPKLFRSRFWSRLGIYQDRSQSPCQGVNRSNPRPDDGNSSHSITLRSSPII
jgi:hypothetical protein